MIINADQILDRVRSAAALFLGLGSVFLLAEMMVAPAFAEGLPPAPGFKQGEIRRDPTGGIVLDGDQIRKRIVPEGFEKRGIGTGFFINGQGDLVTNHHVIDGCGYVTVSPVTGGEKIGIVKERDERQDLALVGTGFRPAVHAPLRSLSSGYNRERYRIIGYPTRTLPPLDPVRETVILLGRFGPRDWVAVEGEVYPGNSGGPAFDLYGRIAGVVVAKPDTAAIYQKTGSVVTDRGFLIAVDHLRVFLEAAGVSYRSVSEAKEFLSDRELDKTVVKLECWRK
ncbi:S1 family peptidase [Aestuariispira insulae]|uniref:Trypsin-like peptidase n=1 Tax=Aestuariispira insulae TaxID=1461337 RepID=A0A3D9HK28_9PROT|nr:serine protease [Aestuariispira insulae]RED49857.1 trypsin-like peptidase [Aestuariispira insulae]